MPSLKSRYRSHTCGELRSGHVGQEVSLSGWLMRKRDHGGVVFVDLRDHYGVTQIVLSDKLGEEMHKLRIESVVRVRGQVVERSPELVNPKIETGKIEVKAAEIELLSAADVLPFQIAEDDKAPEASRLKYRFLELRREKLHNNIVLRSQVIKAIRDIMYDLGFNEFQTPILTSSSPEGARDFIVPSRLHPGKFFALPQAPQQFKQLLMVSGFDRYFQIAPCFRDEDARADRSPGEFYQVDMEMSFVEQEDVFAVGETLFQGIFSRFSSLPMNPPAPFPRLKYDDCLDRYGTDKPDLRIDLEIEDATPIFKESEFKVFRSVVDRGEKVRLLKIDLPQLPPRKYFDDAVEAFSKATGLGLAYVNFESGEHKGTIAKFLKPAELEALKAKHKGPATVMFFAAGPDRHVLPQLGKLRVKVGHDFGRIDKNQWRFVWITDYPMFELNPETNQIDFSHNPFSMPQGGLEALNTKDPLQIYATQYDLVCNGYEMLSGAIRNHVPEIMYRAFEIAGYTHDDVDYKFGGMIRAFKFGAPPHGGFAPGVDRIVMLLAGEEAIRDVIAFPLTQQGEDLLMGAPSTVSEKQLREVHIQIKLPPEAKPAAAG